MPPAIWAVLPVKTFDDAKQRLGVRYDPRFRRGLMMCMVEDVLDALAGAARLAGILVVTTDPEARRMARARKAEVSDRGARGGHTAAVMGAAALLMERGVGGMLALPGDVPGVTASEIDLLVAAHGATPAFTIVPAHDGRGSNGIVATPPNLVPLAYGDDSFVPHLAAARARGVTPRILRLDGLGLDVDHPGDIDMLRERQWSTRTHRFLALADGATPQHQRDHEQAETR